MEGFRVLGVKGPGFKSFRLSETKVLGFRVVSFLGWL